VAAIIVGGYFLFFAGDDSSDNASVNAPAPPAKKGREHGKLKKPKDVTKIKPDQPTAKEFTIDSDRDEKDYALAQAIGSIKTPARISVRLGAAPKQPVTVNWNIVCLLPTEGAKTSSDTFVATPPVLKDLKLPVPDAVTCTATANAQLTRAGRGRIKVFLLGQRRPGG
jgi:hypothetical protein